MATKLDRFFWGGLGTVERLAPGVYRDRLGNLHLEVAEVLAHLRADDTLEAREQVARALVGEVRRIGPGGV
jgi:hypothetical protein